MKSATIILGLMACLVTCQSLIGQTKHRQRPARVTRTSIEDVKTRPDLGVDYSQVAKFKLAARKTAYRVGEMISVDLAIINRSDKPIFFHKVTRPSLELTARDDKGNQISINDYHTVLEGISPEAYRETEPSHLILESFQLIAGCTNDVNAFLREQRNLEHETFGQEAAFFKRVFERDLFVNWGEACLAAEKGGKYTIIAAQTNDTVVVSAKKPTVKTAVGRIQSSPLTLTITE